MRINTSKYLFFSFHISFFQLFYNLVMIFIGNILRDVADIVRGLFFVFLSVFLKNWIFDSILSELGFFPGFSENMKQLRIDIFHFTEKLVGKRKIFVIFNNPFRLKENFKQLTI